MQQVIAPPNYDLFPGSTTVTHAATITREKRANLNLMNFSLDSCHSRHLFILRVNFTKLTNFHALT